uniref:CoA activase n=2 Tax=Aromatoleum toluolicum TaxID=90060 RepID=A0ABX1NL13_9RHOO|nr:CoA activase [Aromatoleum toluolicum]
MSESSFKIAEVIDPRKIPELQPVTTIGIDIGSRQSKAVMVSGDHIHTVITASGVHPAETATRLVNKLLKVSGRQRSDIAMIAGTGYGRIALQFEDIRAEVITEITCHAMGAHFLNASTRTIIDIGGQDCKAIKLDTRNGRVTEFAMNDKCAAGSGRFLEKTAEMLGYSLEELGSRAMASTKELQMSSQCVVFAESEIVSLKAKNETGEDIAAGVHFAIARRVCNLVNRIGLDPELAFSGGVSNNIGVKYALESLLKRPFVTPRLNAVFAGCLGAALIAQQKVCGTADFDTTPEQVEVEA